MVEPISTNLTTEQDFSFGEYGTFEEESQWDDDSQDEVTFLVQPQGESSSPLPINMAIDKPTMSAPLCTEAVDLSPIPMSGFRSPRPLFAPEMSYLALLESRLRLFPPSKRRRLCMSYISVPPLPHDKAEYRTLLLPNHGGLDFPKEKSSRKSKPNLTRQHEHVLARYQLQEGMFVDSSSDNLRLTTKFPRSENHSSHSAPTQRNTSRESEVILPLRKRHQLSAQSMESLLPKKKSKRHIVRDSGGEVRTQSPNVVRRANVTEDSDNDSMQDGEYVTNSEITSVNLRPCVTRSKRRCISDSDGTEWRDVESVLEPGVDTHLTPPPLTMSTKARGKRKAVSASHEKDSSISPQHHIEVDFANNVYLPPCSKPGVIEDSFPPSDNPTTSLPCTASASEGEDLDSFPDLSFFEKYVLLQK
ncbi:uncharacterized protein ARMOST_00187 [Armillaria ostoyae]|uniref:Uncharacterized protein n=1 Tax=Armillaria ostoyae TaxID=47428 RepID=A0A284QKF4_ARMOS|nr:uncharacterized protein ARMOST_00187 [Armillaria ostoyae]